MKPACQWRTHYQTAELSPLANSLPEVCGRVCISGSDWRDLCCPRDGGAINHLATLSYINDKAFEMGWKPDMSHVEWTRAKKVAIAQRDPDRSCCRWYLSSKRCEGRGIWPAYLDQGGLLTFGIHRSSLKKASLGENRRRIFSGMGVNLKWIPKSVKMFVATTCWWLWYRFLGVGTYKNACGLDNEEAPGVYDTLPSLFQYLQVAGTG